MTNRSDMRSAQNQKEETETQALTVAGGSLALVSLDQAGQDSEQDLALNPEFDQSELRLPQMKICQSMTPQRKRTDPNYIKDLSEGDLFNDASGRNYGPGPIKFVMLKYWTNFILFNPIEQGGGIKSRGTLGADGLVRDEAGTILRTEFGPKGEKPEVTKFMNYLLYLPDHQEIVWFSAKSTATGVMKAFHSALRAVKGIADFRKVFTLSTAPTKNGAGQEYCIPVIPKAPLGIVPADSPLAEELRKFARDLADKVIDTSAAETDGEGTTEHVPF